MITETLRRTSGRTSAASVPSDALHEHDLVNTGDARDHLCDARVHGAHAAVDLGEQRDFRLVAHAA